MTISEQAQDHVLWTLEGLLELFEPQPDGDNRFIAQTGLAGADDRQVVEGTQVLAQVALALVHAAQLWHLAGNGGVQLELQYFYLFCGLSVALLGAGRYSLGGSGGKWN